MRNDKSRGKKSVKSTFLIYSPQRAQKSLFLISKLKHLNSHFISLLAAPRLSGSFSNYEKSTWRPEGWPSRADSILPSNFQILLPLQYLLSAEFLELTPISRGNFSTGTRAASRELKRWNSFPCRREISKAIVQITYSLEQRPFSI